MGSGLASAGFDYAAAHQFIQHGVNGLVCPFGDEDALTRESIRLASDPALREILRRAAPESLRQQSWATVIEGFEADLLAEAGKSS